MFGIITRVVLALPALIGIAAEPQATSKAAAPNSAMNARIEFRLDNRIYPKNIRDEDGYARSWRQQADNLAQRAASASEPLARVDALLALANLRLARQTEPAATRWLLGDRSPAGRRQIAEPALDAKKVLGEARQAIARIEKDPSGRRPSDKVLTERKQIADYLSAMAEALIALGQGVRHAEAIAALEPQTRAERPALTAAASLWTVALLSDSGAGDRAVRGTPPATAKPSTLPYDFFRSLLFCQILGERRSYSVASTQLIQLDASVEKWFDPSDRPAARRAVAILRADIAERWASRLEAQQLLTPATQRRAAAALARKELADGQDSGVYRLGISVPTLIDPPAPSAPPRPATTTRAVKPSTAPSRPSPTTTATSRPLKRRESSPTQPATTSQSRPSR